MLYAVSRSGTPLDIPSAAPGVSLKYHRLDLRSEESARALAKTLQHEHGGCNVLVNNAGLYHYTLEKGREKEMREEMLGVNYRGTLMVGWFRICSISMRSFGVIPSFPLWAVVKREMRAHFTAPF